MSENSEISNNENNPCIIIHGGVEPESECSLLAEKMHACRKAASIGFDKMQNGKNSIEAVEAAIRWLEDDEIFNCGYGSILNCKGNVQVDAIIMNGKSLESGSVVAVNGVDHPISLAKYVMENAPNTILCEKTAKESIKNIDGVIKTLKSNMISPGAYETFTSSKEEHVIRKQIFPNYQDGATEFIDGILKDSLGEETVGCIAWDGTTIAVGSTTGGLKSKLSGRLSDSAFLGCSIYANENFGCSVTGHGESTIGYGLARTIVKTQDLKSALDKLYERSRKAAGAVSLTSDGNYNVHFTPDCHRMPYCYINKDTVVCGSELSECNDADAE